MRVDVRGILAMPIMLAFAGGIAPPVAAATFDLVVGAGPGAGPRVKAFDGPSEPTILDFNAFDGGFSGGVTVAVADYDGDGKTDISVGAGATAGPHVKVFDGQTGNQLRSFFAYDTSFTGGVRVAAGDINGDGRSDIVTGAGAGGGAHVKVFDGATGSELRSFFAFTGFSGGINVASGDVNGDGRDDIVVSADASGAPHVKVFDGVNGDLLHSFFAYDNAFTGGVTVAAGDIDGDGFADVVAGAGAGAAAGHVKVFSGQTGEILHEFFSFDQSFTGGVSVAAGLYDGRTSLMVGTLSDAAIVHVFQDFGGPPLLTGPALLAPTARFQPFDGFEGGVSVAASFINPVPEPATWLQLVTGFGLAGAALRTRRRAAA